MKTKTISGHYDTVFSLEHNNREFVPKNVSVDRTYRNYNCIVAGGEVYMDLDTPRYLPDFWRSYHNLSEIYWSDRAIAKTLAYEKYQEKLDWLRIYRQLRRAANDSLVGAVFSLLLLPLTLACDIYMDQRWRDARAEWEQFKQEQWLRDIDFNAEKHSLRDALGKYDCVNGTNRLQKMDSLVREMAMYAGDCLHGSRKLAPLNPSAHRFATLEEIYDCIYEPSFQAFQAKQRPCRRYNGSYLQQIRENQALEHARKQQSKKNRNRKTAEAIEIVFCIGDMDNTGYCYARSDAEKAELILKDYCDHLLSQKNLCFVTTKELKDPHWQPPFRNGLIILNLTVHCDEATPGIHLTCIPYSRNCKRGPAVQSSLGRALAGMGYPSTWKNVLDENGEPIPKRNRNGDIIYNKDGSIRYKQEPDGQGILDWIEEQKQWIQKEMYQRHAWEREYKGSHPRGNLSIPDYKVARAEERRKEIEGQIDTMLTSFNRHIEVQIDRLNESVDKAWANADDIEIFVRFFNTCAIEEREHLLKYARDRLDYLPAQEKERVKPMLAELIRNAEKKAINQNSATKAFKDKSKDDIQS